MLDVCEREREKTEEVGGERGREYIITQEKNSKEDGTEDDIMRWLQGEEEV